VRPQACGDLDQAPRAALRAVGIEFGDLALQVALAVPGQFP
jgi:hypothetical protein